MKESPKSKKKKANVLADKSLISRDKGALEGSDIILDDALDCLDGSLEREQESLLPGDLSYVVEKRDPNNVDQLSTIAIESDSSIE